MHFLFISKVVYNIKAFVYIIFAHCAHSISFNVLYIGKEIFYLGKRDDFYNLCSKAWGVRSTLLVAPSVPSGAVLVEIENLPRSPGTDQHDRKWFVNSLNQNKILLAYS